ncbi:transposase [Variovorax sp. J22R115]|uniref:transposase n=1 Tax=Variovorax sp. J22R115 TaxID=3053509 RepID=UPI0034DE35D4
MQRTRRTFTDEFKREAVKLVKQPAAPARQACRVAGLRPNDQSTIVGPNCRRAAVVTNL